MSTSDTSGGRVRARRPHPTAASTLELLMGRVLTELEQINDLLQERLPARVEPDPAPAVKRVQEPAPAPAPAPPSPRRVAEQQRKRR